MNDVVSKRPGLRAVVAAITVMVVLSPVFAWAADGVGYAEPLENVAEETGAVEHEIALHLGFMPDYAVPGMNEYAGTLVSAAVGTVVTFLVALGLGRFLGT